MTRSRAKMLLALALAIAAAAIGVRQYRNHLRTYFTDGDAIRQPARNATPRDILWRPPVALPDFINLEGDASEPFLSADGMTLLFVRAAPGRHADIYSCVRIVNDRGEATWSQPEPLCGINTFDDERGPALSSDGRTLYFSSNRPGGSGGYDLWSSQRGEHCWHTPINLGPAVNSAFDEFAPAMSPDAGALWFASNRPRQNNAATNAEPDTSPAAQSRDPRDRDLYAAAVVEGELCPAQPVAGLNTSANEDAPAFSPAGDFVYFCSDRIGGEGAFDLYRARVLLGEPQQPENLGPELNTAHNELDPALSLSGFALHFSSDRPVGAESATPKRLDLYYTQSREVFSAMDAGDALDWATFLKALASALWWLLLSLLLLLVLLGLWRGVQSPRLSLLARCLLASLLVHLVILFLLTLWQVTTSVTDFMQRDGGRRVALSSATPGDAILEQIRGNLTDVSVAAELPISDRAISDAPAVETSLSRVELAAEQANVQAEPQSIAALELNDAQADAPPEMPEPTLRAPALMPQTAQVAMPAATAVMQADEPSVSSPDAQLARPTRGDASRELAVAHAEADMPPVALPPQSRDVSDQLSQDQVIVAADEASDASIARQSMPTREPAQLPDAAPAVAALMPVPSEAQQHVDTVEPQPTIAGAVAFSDHQQLREVPAPAPIAVPTPVAITPAAAAVPLDDRQSLAAASASDATSLAPPPLNPTTLQAPPTKLNAQPQVRTPSIAEPAALAGVSEQNVPSPVASATLRADRPAAAVELQPSNAAMARVEPVAPEMHAPSVSLAAAISRDATTPPSAQKQSIDPPLAEDIAPVEQVAVALPAADQPQHTALSEPQLTAEPAARGEERIEQLPVVRIVNAQAAAAHIEPSSTAPDLKIETFADDSLASARDAAVSSHAMPELAVALPAVAEHDALQQDAVAIPTAGEQLALQNDEASIETAGAVGRAARHDAPASKQLAPAEPVLANIEPTSTPAAAAAQSIASSATSAAQDARHAALSEPIIASQPPLRTPLDSIQVAVAAPAPAQHIASEPVDASSALGFEAANLATHRAALSDVGDQIAPPVQVIAQINPADVGAAPAAPSLALQSTSALRDTRVPELDPQPFDVSPAGEWFDAAAIELALPSPDNAPAALAAAEPEMTELSEHAPAEAMTRGDGSIAVQPQMIDAKFAQIEPTTSLDDPHIGSLASAIARDALASEIRLPSDAAFIAAEAAALPAVSLAFALPESQGQPANAANVEPSLPQLVERHAASRSETGEVMQLEPSAPSIAAVPLSDAAVEAIDRSSFAPPVLREAQTPNLQASDVAILDELNFDLAASEFAAMAVDLPDDGAGAKAVEHEPSGEPMLAGRVLPAQRLEPVVDLESTHASSSAARLHPDAPTPLAEPSSLAPQLPLVSESQAQAEAPNDSMLLVLMDAFKLPHGAAFDLRIPREAAPLVETYGRRSEARRNEILERMGGSEETERAVRMALEWLAKHQSQDGRWAANRFDAHCGACGGAGRYHNDVATTSLTLLCFLGADHTHFKDGAYRWHVQRGIDWVVGQQRANGDLRGSETMYSHAIAAIMLAEAYGMTHDPRLREPVQRAVDFIVSARNRNVGGWRYEPGQSGDTSVLGWVVMAMVSAKRAGLNVPDEALSAAKRWLDLVDVEGVPGRYAYQPGQRYSPSMTAEGMYIQQLLGEPHNAPHMQGSADYIVQHLPRWDLDANTYYWYYATLALFQHQGEHWTRWNEVLRAQLLANQRTTGAAAGSWDPVDNWSKIGGRIYQTAMCTLSLEVYYRYLPMYEQIESAKAAD